MSAPLLREISRTELDHVTLGHIKRCARQTRTRFTLFEGLVTKKVWILFHEARRPSATAVDAFLREEFAALPAASEVAQ